MPGLTPLDVLIVRHAEPMATADDPPLTAEGLAAADELARELEDFTINAVYSSPAAACMATVAAIASGRGIEVHQLGDLRERHLASEPHADSRAMLEHGWTDPDFATPEGESSRSAQRRAIGTLDLLRSRHPDGGRLVIGSHANLISLMLHALEPEIGFAFQAAMPMPALYRLTHDGLRWRIAGGHGFAVSDPPSDG